MLVFLSQPGRKTMATIDEVYELLDTINKKTLKRMETDNANVFKRIEERFNQPKTMATIGQQTDAQAHGD